jgi:tetratricopeptide (TPR) repeat protein
VATELSDRPLVAAEIHTVLGQTYASLGLYDRARTHLDQALETHAREHGPEHVETGRSLVRLGRLAWDQGDYADAEEILTRATGVLAGTLPPDDPELAVAHADRAAALRMTARPDEARALYEEACDVLRRAFPDEPATAEVLSDFAGLHASQGRFDDAAALYAEALAVFQVALPEDHPHLAIVMHNLAALESRRGNHAEAVRLHAVAAEKLERIYGPEHPHVGTVVHGLGISHWQLRELDAAEVALRRALAIRRASLGDHPHLASTLSGLAKVLQAAGRPAEALPLLDEAIAIYASQTVVDEVQLRLSRELREACQSEAGGTAGAASPP